MYASEILSTETRKCRSMKGAPITDRLSVEWLAFQQRERTPPSTIARRESVLRSVGNAGEATREQIEEWWRERADRDLAQATRANDLATLRAFYKWCSRWEHRADDPTSRLDAPKVDKGLPRPMSRGDLHQLLATLPDDLRRAVALGAYAGLRVSEVAALHWRDVDTVARRARILHSKGGKSRTVALGAVLVDQMLPEMDGYVVTGSDRPVSAAQLQRRVNRAIRAAGIDGTFHTLRHRYGTLAYQATRDLVAVGRQMGHSSPVTTAIYAAASDDVADEIAAAVTR